MKTAFLFLVLAGGSASALAQSASPPAGGQVAFFENRIRPVLAEHCYRCHSFSEGKSKGGLTLDTRDGWQKGGETGPAIIPGQPDDSLLIKAVRYHDSETAMPPGDGKMPDKTIADLEEWVRMGAPDPRVTAPGAAKAGGPMTESMKAKAAQHWAYQPVKTPAVPAVQDTAWPANPIDHFILAQLEQNSLTPSPPAGKRTLIRRVYLDLIGLPPTPDEVLAFVEDESPQAFEMVVDDLLARPQYGERWGRHWLDVARYADTRGSAKKAQTTLNPNAWTYRDYVISAFNQDKPFDQFIREQIAADLLPGRSNNASLAALGFLTQGDQFMGSRQDIINDRIDVVSKGFLGLTVTCARCHDHKFDPIPQTDYYSLHGIFDSCREPSEKPVVVAAVVDARSTDYQEKRKKLEEAGREKLAAAMNRAASTFNQKARAFMGLAGIDRKSPAFFSYLKAHHLDGRIVQEVGRLFQQSMGGRAGEGHPVMQPLRRLMAMRPDNFIRAFPAWQAGLLKDTAGIHSNSAIRAVFTNAQPKSREEALDFYASVFLKADAAWREESVAWSKAGGRGFFPGVKDSALEEVRTAVADPGRFHSGPLDSQLKALPREIEIMANGINAALATLEVSHAGSPGLANVLEDERKPHNSPVLLRGQLQNPGPVVPRQFLEVLSGPERQPFTQGSGRLELAAAIASPSNPLTARVLVNRLWLHHFGEGFISTPDDLGVMSGAPSHPELLDYLASAFMEDGWSLKQLHRKILLSKTWQQSSGADPEKAKIDSFNRFLWRQNLHRLDFEALRDSLLFMGGQLDLTMGGHPVNIESEPYSKRRSVYGYLDRNEMAEFMRHFDVANASLPTGRRFQTIVPQQALFRMNSLLVIEQARNIVQRPDFQACDSDAGRMKKLYEIIYQRWPKPREVELATAYLRGQSTLGQEPDSGTTATASSPTAAFTRDERRAVALEEFRKKKLAQKGLMDPKRQAASVKEAVRDPGAEKVDRSPLTPWEKYAQALLMTSEMAYVD